MVVTKIADVVADDEDTVKITGVVAGATVSVIVDPDEVNALPAELAKGNVILYAESGAYVTDVEVLYSSTEDGLGGLGTVEDIVADGSWSEEFVTIHTGEITAKGTKYVELDDADKYYFADEVNVIVVDYTGNKMTVKAGDLGDVKKSSTKYDQNAFVKTTAEDEDVITDIVVFTTAVER